jgi:flagellar hook-length control protein FliK
VWAAPNPTETSVPVLAERDPDLALVEGGVRQEPLAETRQPAALPDHRHPSETARSIAQQLAPQMQKAANGTIELALNPEELGKVKLSLHPTEAGVTLAVTAERPETMDLMRRHIALLEQELRQMGYGSVSFSFGQQSSGQSQGDSRQPIRENRQFHSAEIPPTPKPQTATSGLDLRL